MRSSRTMRLGMLLAHVLAAPPAAGTAKPTTPVTVPGKVLLHLADDDSPAAHELAALIERHGDQTRPPIRVATPPANLSRLAAARAACTGDVAGVFWLDAGRADEWRLYAVPCTTLRPLVREILVTAGAEQASIEASWLITRSSAAAISQPDAVAMAEADASAIDTPAAVTPPPAEPAATTAPAPAKPTPSSQRRRSVQVSLGYAGEVLARTVPWQSGGWAAVAWAPRERLRIGAWYELLAPGRTDDPPGFAVWHHGIAITIAGVFTLARRAAIEVRGGPELELSRWRSTDLGRSRPRSIPRVGADATLQIGLVPGRLTLDLGLGAAVALVDVDFVTCAATSDTACTGDGRRVVVDALRVRPRARAGLSVQF